MFHELVLIPQAVFVKHMVFIDHDGVFDAPTQGQVVRAEEFNVTHKTKGSSTTDFLDEGST